MSGQREQLDENAIRKIVWDGPYVETDEGRTVRGAVGLTHGGAYRAAEVSLYQEHGPSGGVAFERESHKWDTKQHDHKEQAIFAARKMVANAVRTDRQPDMSDQTTSTPCKSVAAKYGGASDEQERQIRPPSRSR